MSQEKKPIVDSPEVTTSPTYPDWQASTTVYNRGDLEAAEALDTSDKIVITEVPLVRKEKPSFDVPEREPLSRRNRIKNGVASVGAAKKASSGPSKKKTTGESKKASSASVAASKAASEAPKRRKDPSDTEKKHNPKKKKKKGHPIIKWFFLLMFCACLFVGAAVFYYVYTVISETPPIDPTNIADKLNETSVMYDADGNEMDVIFYGANRELATIDQMPKHLQDAFIAIEDKTFRTHHGFNVTRIIGAIVESLRGGGQISGTSTITQQLARNVFLTDTQFEYSIKRKIAEAYYSLKIEKALSKDEILEAYLNTIYFGYGSWGIETAAQSYFGKSVSQLTIAESAALAVLPQLPDAYQLVNFVEGGTAEQYADIALKETSDGVYIVNDVSRERRRMCLGLMLDQELITQAEYDAAIRVELKDMLHPDFTTYNTGPATYFADYVITDVINDLMEEKGMDYNTAWKTVYQGGLTIYSTMNPTLQQIATDEIANPDNYPPVYPSFDSEGNAINADGILMLRAYDNYFDENGNCYIPSDQYDKLADGRMIIYYGNFLKIYETTVGDAIDYSLELPPMYYYDENWDYYSIAGGYINVPMNYKSANSDGDLIISAEFFQDYPDFFSFNEEGSCVIPPTSYTLGGKTIQPQSAITVIENRTGHIIAMVGGRGATGRKIFNRATATHQPGSSIKPIAVYSAALQQSVEEMLSGQTHTFVNYGIDKQGAKLYGSYLTAGSIVVDEKTTINGKEWPKNASRTNMGPVTMRTAIVNSLNTCSVKVLYQVGIDYSVQNVKRFGITTLVEEGDANDLNVAALALGAQAQGVSTLEMASAFTVFPNNGVRYKPSAYTKVLDRHGNILLENNPVPEEVLDPGVAWIMSDMMRGVVMGSSGNIDGAWVSGKTGTTENAYDIWFDGSTNNYTASVWIGNDFGASLDATSWRAIDMWSAIMRQFDGTYEGERAPMPDNVIYYAGEYYVAGTEKGAKSIKDYEKKVKICKECGLLATPECKDVEEKKYLEYDDEEIKDIPKEYCYLHNSDPAKYPTTAEGMKHIEEKKKKEEADNKAAADPVIAMINALPASPTPSDEAAIVAARSAFNALTDQQKAAVGNDVIAKLSDAETKLEAAKAQAAEEEAKKKAEEEEKKRQEEEARRKAEEEEKRRQEEAARKQAECDQWLAERESHKIWVQTQAPREAYSEPQLDDAGNPVLDDDGNPVMIEHPAVEEQGYWDYEEGWRDQDSKCQ